MAVLNSQDIKVNRPEQEHHHPASFGYVSHHHPGCCVCHNQRRRRRATISHFHQARISCCNVTLQVLKNMKVVVNERVVKRRVPVCGCQVSCVSSGTCPARLLDPMSSKGKSDCKLKVKDPLQFSSSAPPLGTQTTDPAKVIKQAADGERCRH